MSLPPSPIIFANNPLDRAGHQRNDTAWLREHMLGPHALFVPLWNLCPLVLPELHAGDGRDVGWLPRDVLKDVLTPARLCIFLGINKRGKPLFALDISDMSAPEDRPPFKGMGQFEDLRALAAAGDMSAGEVAILAQAKAMLDWHIRHGFCARCGGETTVQDSGYKRVCAACSAEHFPRTDPVVIMLAIYEDMCLLGRQAGWPENMFSALAGFVEPGETIEEAVAREMMEEAGVTVTHVQYHASQPWPFPASLMIGCLAQAKSTDMYLDGIELADARWVSRADIRAALNGEGTFGVPPPMAIAHHLVKAFAQQDT